MESLIFGLCLIVIMIIWNMYLLRQNQELVNKLMSRNYAEYESVKSLKSKDPVIDPIEVDDSFDTQRARELNGIFGG